MRKGWVVVGTFLVFLGCSRNPKVVVDNVSRALGAANVKTIQYAGNGSIFALGQSVNPDAPWPKFNLRDYSRLVDYEKGAMREEDVRTQFENPPRGGGLQPVLGARLAVGYVSGDTAWNLTPDAEFLPVPAAADERQLQIWITPHGWVKAAAAANPTVESKTVDGKPVTVVSFLANGKYKVHGFVNGENLLEKVETWLPNPVLGDMLVETSYSDYKDFSGVKFPTRIVQKQGGFPTLELTVTEVQPNAPDQIEVPESVRNAPPPAARVESQKVADGVWFVAGGSHNSVAIEFQDFAAVVEGPLNEERSLAVIAEVKKLIPNKPIRYLINTHHHFDHSGGLRTYVAEGSTIVTHQINQPFYERVFASARELRPDALAKNPRKAVLETFTDKHVLTDGSRVLELHLIQGSGHNDGILMAYLPRERIVIEADVFTPPPPKGPLPPASSFLINFNENLQRLRLDVRQILPIHGRITNLAELRKVLGKAG